MCFYTMLYGRFSTYSRKDTAHPANRSNITHFQWIFWGMSYIEPFMQKNRMAEKTKTQILVLIICIHNTKFIYVSIFKKSPVTNY